MAINKNEPIKNQIVYNELCDEYNLIMHEKCKECVNKCKQYYSKSVPLRLTCNKFIDTKVVINNARTK